MSDFQNYFGISPTCGASSCVVEDVLVTILNLGLCHTSTAKIVSHNSSDGP
jgi:hypothetical protein